MPPKKSKKSTTKPKKLKFPPELMAAAAKATEAEKVTETATASAKSPEAKPTTETHEKVKPPELNSDSRGSLEESEKVDPVRLKAIMKNAHNRAATRYRAIKKLEIKILNNGEEPSERDRPYPRESAYKN